MPVTISNQRLGPVGQFVEAPAAPGRISPLEAKWICGDGRLSRAIYPFLQVPQLLLTRQVTTTACRHKTITSIHDISVRFLRLTRESDAVESSFYKTEVNSSDYFDTSFEPFLFLNNFSSDLESQFTC